MKENKKGEQIQSVLMHFFGNDEVTNTLKNYIYGNVEKNDTENNSQKKEDN